MATQFLLGSDPEVFLQSISSGKYISGHGIIPGTKSNPEPLGIGMIQLDGTAVEFNIPPAGTREDFRDFLSQMLVEIAEFVHVRNPDLRLAITPSVVFDPEYFSEVPEECKVLGCEPDYDAYTKGENPRPNPNHTMRTGSGHIHIGWTVGERPFDPDHFGLCTEVVRQLDLSLLFLQFDWDKDTRRRSLYGRGGSFRPKHFGVEYRPLSNAFLRKQETMDLVYNNTMVALKLMENDILLKEDPVLDGLLKKIEYGMKYDEEAVHSAKIRLDEYGFQME